MNDTYLASDKGARAEIDPITFSVILNRFNTIAHEMTLTLERSAYTSILALARDFSCAIYDVDSRQVCMFEALPVHTTSMHLVLKEIADTFAGDINEGDVFAANDPHRMNTHIGDLVTARPVFIDGRHVFWSVTKGHQIDTGAYIPSSVVGTARDVYQEGITIPPVKLFVGGKRQDDICEILFTNVRFREGVEGDLLAQLGSINKAADRLEELCEEYGVDEVMRYVDAIIDYSDRRMSEEIRAIPDGVYEGEQWVDSDGVDRANIPVRCKVLVEDDQITVDWTGSGDQAQGGVNGSLATTTAASGVPIMCAVASDIPHNDGSIRHIKVIADQGTICWANFPGSTSAATVVPSCSQQDAVGKALVEAIPDRIAAGGGKAANTPTLSGIDPRTGKQWGYMCFNNHTGSGASEGADGWPVFGPVSCLGGLKSMSIELQEQLYPIRYERMEVEPGSMGLGKWIGGPGNRIVVRPLHGDLVSITFGDGCDNPPHGVLGGTPGFGGGQWVEGPDGGPRTFGSACARLETPNGHSWVGVSTGGGGYGNPLERDVEQVRRDVRDGFISRESAWEIFGVALDESVDPVVQEEATERRRSERAAKSDLTIRPAEPGASTWLKDHMNADDVYLLNV
jgi:N-methylhydantoinase B